MDIYHQFDDIRQQYSSTLFDSRLIVFGLNTDGSAIDPQLRHASASSREGSPEHKPNGNRIPQQDSQNSNHVNGSPGKSTGQKMLTKTSPTFTDPLNANALNSDGTILEEDEDDENGFLSSQAAGIGNHLPKEANSSQIIFYPSVDNCMDLEDRIQEFVSSLFWVLESKRLDRSSERLDKLFLLTAPFEKKDIVGIDTDSRWGPIRDLFSNGGVIFHGERMDKGVSLRMLVVVAEYL